MNDMEITFPGGDKVNALWNGFEIATDQEGAAPAPYDLFLASLATCAGIYVIRFIRTRGLNEEGLKVTQSMDWDPVTHRLTKVRMKIDLPAGFPEKYRPAIVRAAEQCAVKRALHAPPDFEITAG